MRHRRLIVAALLAVFFVPGGPVPAQSQALSEAECRALRQRLTEHARLSDGVRRLVASKVVAAPGVAPVTPAAAPGGRAGTIRARLEQVSKERQALEDQRLAAMVRLDFSRAKEIQGQIQGLDTEKANLERELGNLPAAATPAPPPAPAAPVATGPDAQRIRCEDAVATVEGAVRIRQQELGARQGQPGAIPLVALKGQTAEQIAQELAAQFASGPAALNQIGLLDADGDAKLDGFVDVPTPGVFRLVRQRSDGSLAVEVFAPAGPAAIYGDLTRRLDETVIRQAGQTLADLLATRPAGPNAVVVEATQFDQARGQVMAGSFADAGRIAMATARSAEFPNYRGETVHAMEVISPVAGGVGLRRVVVVAQAGGQLLWDETVTVVQPTSYWRVEGEITRAKETWSAAGARVGTRATTGPVRFIVER